MVTVTVCGCAREARDDDERAIRADDAHHVGEHFAFGPTLLTFGARLRETKIERAREELIAAIEPARLQQLFGADDAQRIEQLWPDQILPALAAIEREIADARAVAACEPRDQSGVFVVRVRARVQHTRRRLQAAQHEAERDRAFVRMRAHLGVRRRVGRRQKAEGRKQ